MHTCLFTYIHIYKHTIYIHTYIHTSVCNHRHTYTCLCNHIYTYIYTHMYMYTSFLNVGGCTNHVSHLASAPHLHRHLGNIDYQFIGIQRIAILIGLISILYRCPLGYLQVYCPFPRNPLVYYFAV